VGLSWDSKWGGYNALKIILKLKKKGGFKVLGVKN
jgi:hypothetical protein